MGHDELEQELRPGRRPGLARPFWQGLSLEQTDEGALAERAIGDDGDAAIPGQGQDPRLNLSVQHVVGHLSEIDGLFGHDRFELAMAATFGRRDADVANLALRLHLEQLLQVPLPRDEIVHLHKVKARHAPIAARLLDLHLAACDARDPDLVGREEMPWIAELFEPVADGALCGAVHRRRIDDASAGLEERRHYSRAFLKQLRVVAHVERDPAPQSDDRQSFACLRNRLRDISGALSRAKMRVESGSGARQQRPFQKSTPSDLHNAAEQTRNSAGI